MLTRANKEIYQVQGEVIASSWVNLGLRKGQAGIMIITSTSKRAPAIWILDHLKVLHSILTDRKKSSKSYQLSKMTAIPSISS